MNFKKLEINDKKLIDNCLKHKTSRSCDYCFANLFAWQGRYNTCFAIEQNTLFVRFDNHGEKFYMFPTGEMTVEDAFEILQNDTKKQNILLKIKAVSPEMWNNLPQSIAKNFSFVPESNNFEYIYRSEKLRLLTGKKLQSKRNHINRFKKENPLWEFAPVASQDDCRACLNMLQDWENETQDAAFSEGNPYDDFDAATLMLTHFDVLELQGAMIKIGNEIVAFAIGEPLTEDSFVVHIEKAHRTMNGGYAIINQQFAEYIGKNFVYINREEDMGIESLRQAKLSYQPDLILQEGVMIAHG